LGECDGDFGLFSRFDDVELEKIRNSWHLKYCQKRRKYG